MRALAALPQAHEGHDGNEQGKRTQEPYERACWVGDGQARLRAIIPIFYFNREGKLPEPAAPIPTYANGLGDGCDALGTDLMGGIVVAVPYPNRFQSAPPLFLLCYFYSFIFCCYFPSVSASMEDCTGEGTGEDVSVRVGGR